MKKLLTIFSILTLTSSISQLQEVTNVNVPLPSQNNSLNSFPSSTETTVCGLDTVGYTVSKATGLQLLNINNATSATGMAQYFDAPQSLTISGLSFYGYKGDLNGGTTININVQIYAAAADSTPTGPILTSAVINIDTNFYGGTFDQLKKHVTFTSPLTTSLPYVVVITNPSPSPVNLIFNSYTAGDGASEWLSSALIGASWLRSYNVNVGGVPFDADCLFEPHVTYSINTDFTINDPCFLTGNSLTFLNTSSPIIQNKMYNIAAFQGIPDYSFNWNYGDGSPLQSIINGAHTYASSGIYPVTLTDTIFGWTMTCAESKTISTEVPPNAAWTSSSSGLSATFTNASSMSSSNTYFWDFGDGNTSTLENPVHVYGSAGTYTACLILNNSCSADTSCMFVTVTCAAPIVTFTNTNTNLSVAFNNTSTVASGVGYLWDFGDGNTSTVTNPTHVYSTSGSYTVCLTVVDNCGADSTCMIVNVTNCITPTASFNVTGSGASYNFTSTSTTTGSVIYAWNFGDGNSSSTMNPSHNYLSNGNFTVTLTITDSCGTSSTTQTVTSAGVGLNELETAQLLLYPNPAQNVLKIESNQNISFIELQNVLGQKVSHQAINSLTHEIDLNHLANGTYFVSVRFDSGMIQVKKMEIRQ